MDSFTAIVTRGNILVRGTSTTTSTNTTLSPTVIDLLIVLTALVFLTLWILGGLAVVRMVRRARAIERQSLPQYEPTPVKNIHRHTRSNSRRLTISTARSPSIYGNRSSVFIYDEKSSVVSATDKEMGFSSGECSPTDVPEIRITFPDEQDESGRPKSGRVVIVRVTDTGVGLEPLSAEEDRLPAYEKEMGGRFHSIDMDRIGGLKEKSEWS